MYVLHRNRQSSRSLSAWIFIFVACLHIAILTSMKGYLSNQGPRPEPVRLLESFVIEAHEPTPASSRDPTQTTPPPTRTSSPATTSSAPWLSEVQQNTSSRTRTINPSTINPNTNHQSNKSQDALTPPITHAIHLHNPPPPYPRQSRRLGEQGKVVIAVAIDIDGTSAEAVIHQSSGHPRLDRAALATVLKWRFVPGKRGNENQKMWVNIPINFVLE